MIWQHCQMPGCSRVFGDQSSEWNSALSPFPPAAITNHSLRLFSTNTYPAIHLSSYTKPLLTELTAQPTCFFLICYNSGGFVYFFLDTNSHQHVSYVMHSFRAGRIFAQCVCISTSQTLFMCEPPGCRSLDRWNSCLLVAHFAP